MIIQSLRPIQPPLWRLKSAAKTSKFWDEKSSGESEGYCLLIYFRLNTALYYFYYSYYSFGNQSLAVMEIQAEEICSQKAERRSQAAGPRNQVLHDFTTRNRSDLSPKLSLSVFPFCPFGPAFPQAKRKVIQRGKRRRKRQKRKQRRRGQRRMKKRRWR